MYSDAGNALSGKDKEVHSLETQLSAVELNLQALSHQKNEVDEELRQLKGDLMMMTKENQVSSNTCVCVPM